VQKEVKAILIELVYLIVTRAATSCKSQTNFEPSSDAVAYEISNCTEAKRTGPWRSYIKEQIMLLFRARSTLAQTGGTSMGSLIVPESERTEPPLYTRDY
jgi:hypothetical protein